MTYYRTCPECGAHLDPEEKCDCIKKSVCAQTQNGKHEKTQNYYVHNTIAGGKSQEEE